VVGPASVASGSCLGFFSLRAALRGCASPALSDRGRASGSLDPCSPRAEPVPGICCFMAEDFADKGLSVATSPERGAVCGAARSGPSPSTGSSGRQVGRGRCEVGCDDAVAACMLPIEVSSFTNPCGGASDVTAGADTALDAACCPLANPADGSGGARARTLSNTCTPSSTWGGWRTGDFSDADTERCSGIAVVGVFAAGEVRA